MISSPTIYRIDKSHREIRGITHIEDVILRILNASLLKLGYTKRLSYGDLNSHEIDGTTYYLYTYNTDEKESNWYNFLPEELTENRNFLQQRISLILFAEIEKELFVAIGGDSYRIILPFLDQSYGLNTYARIMQPQEDDLVSIQSRGLTGTRIGMNEQFRGNFRIIDFIKFGKVPEKILVLISETSSKNHFQFLIPKSKKRVLVSFGKGIKFKNAIDFNILHELLLELYYVGDLVASDYLSSYKEIRDPEFIDKNLKSIVIQNLYDDIPYVIGTPRESVNRFHFDFCNPSSIEKFYEADYYILLEKTDKGGHKQFDIVYDKQDIYDTVVKRAINYHKRSSKFDYMVYLQGVRVNCYRDKKKTTGASFLFHITTEIKVNEKSYFLVDTKWYSLRDSFVADLKESTAQIFSTYKAPQHILELNWDKKKIKKEGDYNMLYNGRDNYFVLDTFIIDGVELCDIVYVEKDTLYLIHVKYGFGANVRELTNQILISARRLKEVISSGNLTLLEKLYEKLIRKTRSVNEISVDEFKNLFKKKIVYVFAMASHLREDFPVEDHIELYNSNIARFSLIQCSSEMRANYYDMMIYQIPRNRELV